MRVALFSTGLPDPTQGGSGIFNYYVVRELLRQGHRVTAYLRANQSFLARHTVGRYLDELIGMGLKYELVEERAASASGLLLDGYNLLLRAHKYDVCRELVVRRPVEWSTFDAFVIHDLGWAAALADCETPGILIFSDPLSERIRHGTRFPPWTPRAWKRALQLRLLEAEGTYRTLARTLANRFVLGSFSPHHAEQYRSRGVPCRHFRWFSPEPEAPIERTPNKGRFRMVHVGALATTASRQMIRYWQDELLPVLATLPFVTEITFVGRYDSGIRSAWDNVELKFVGHEGSLIGLLSEADAFFSPMRYPVGTRTRILTALSYGLPVIADHSAALGLPELVHGEDILYGSNPGEIRELVRKLRDDVDLRQVIGRRARSSWSRLFNPQENVRLIIDELTSIGRRAA